MLLSTREAYMKVKAIADCDSSFLVLGNFSSAPITRQMQAKREPIVLTLFEQMLVSPNPSNSLQACILMVHCVVNVLPHYGAH